MGLVSIGCFGRGHDFAAITAVPISITIAAGTVAFVDSTLDHNIPFAEDKQEQKRRRSRCRSHL